MNYNQIVQDVLDQLKKTPIDMLGIGKTEGEDSYLNSTRDAYVRTIRDIDQLCENKTPPVSG